MTPAPPPSADTTHAASYDVVLAVKRLHRAKTRLADLGDDLRRDLVVAFLLDTVLAVTRSPRVAGVAIVTDEARLAAAVTAAGLREAVTLVPDVVPSELNAALRLGARSLRQREEHPRSRGVLGLAADLPALTSRSVTDLLDAVPVDRGAFVSDREGTGTTAYASADPARFDPRFGPGSRAAHAADGALDLSERVPASLRCDVDTRDDLDHVLGRVGAHTTAVLARYDYSPLLG